MPVKNMGVYLAGMVRSGKLKKEELFDFGLLKLDANNKAVGGTLFDLSSNTPNMVIGKFTVDWGVIGQDGHPLTDSFTFKVE